MQKKYFILGMLSVVLVLAAMYAGLSDGRLHVIFFSVGQGDSALVRTPRGENILIDAGPSTKVVEHLGESLGLFENHIDLFVISHSDNDHITGAIEVLRRYGVGMLMVSAAANDTVIYEQLLEEAEIQGTSVVLADNTADFCLGEVCVNTLWPPAKQFQDESRNNLSLVMRLVYGQNSVLFTGDIEAGVEDEILKQGVSLKSDILKVAHHGSKTSSTQAFLNAVGEGVAVVSVGADNFFGHPHAEVLERIQLSGKEIYRTDIASNIYFESDGQTWFNLN